MIIMGIDPGTTSSAWVLLDGDSVRASGHATNWEILDLLANSEADAVACEWIESMGMAVGREVFETCYWVGRMSEVHPEFRRVGRRAVKLHLCGSSRAKDKNIRQAVVDCLGPPGTKAKPGPTYGVSSHRWQALAVAVTWRDLGAECEIVTP